MVLKNGRRIAIQNYREEGGMVKFYGLGGEIGISKDQIRSINKSGQENEKDQGMIFKGKEPPGEDSTRSGRERAAETSAEPKERAPITEERSAGERPSEEAEYGRKVKEITEQIRILSDRYAVATRGTSTPEPGLLEGEKAIRSRTDDLISRLRDAQHNPAGPSDAGAVKLQAPSPFTGAPPTTIELRPGEIAPSVDTPPPTYTERQKELSEIRNRINQLENDRERLIEEMKRKGFDTGSLFLE